VDLANLAAAGDRRAFGELVRRHATGVRSLLRRMGAAPSEADDAAQDTFLAAFESISEFRGEGAFAGWVKKIAVRLYVRRMKREKRLALLAADSALQELPPTVSDTATRMALDDALNLLQPAELMAVTLCYGAGLSHVEAAEALNLPLGTVKSHVKRGLEKLRARLATSENLASAGGLGNG
jgi:RNA polymerase sigma-70 factor (ECF subfamily)